MSNVDIAVPAKKNTWPNALATIPLLIALTMLGPDILGAKGKALPTVKTALKAAPAAFVQNIGQVRNVQNSQQNDIKFVLKEPGFTLFVANDGLHYQFTRKLPDAAGHSQSKKGASPHATFESARIDMRLVGANTHSAVDISHPSKYYENYDLGKRGTGLQTAASCRGIRIKNVYPHIDWLLKTDEKGVSYEFDVHRGGDPSKIKLRYDGQTGMKCDPSGNMILTSALGMVKENAPICRDADGQIIPSHYVADGNELTFATAAKGKPMLIDPLLEWGTYYGFDTSSTLFYALVCDDSANIYACGGTYTANEGMIATTGAFDTVYEGNEDAFLVKFDSSGNRLWATYYGGSQIDWAAAVALDPAGNVFIAGSTASDSGIATPGTQEPVYIGGQWDAFLAKFTTGGNLVWGTYVGGTDSAYYDIEVSAVCTDNLGHVYVSGACDDITNISTPGCWKYVKTEGVDHYDSYLIQYNDSSGLRNWGTYYGGNKDDMTGVSVSDGTNVYIAGYTQSDTGIASSTGYQPALNGSSDAYLAKFDPAGNRLWGTYYGGSGNEDAGGVALDNNRNVYLLGATNSDSSIATPGCAQDTLGGGLDAFLVQFDQLMGYREWGTYFGGPADENVDFSRIVTDSAGNIYIVGKTASTSGIATAGSWQTTFGGGSTDGFIAKYNNTGGLQWATYYGGEADDNIFACGFDGTGLYVCGQTNSTTGIATPDAFLPVGGGLTFYFQGFLSKFIDDSLLSTKSVVAIRNASCNIYPVPNHGNFTLSATIGSYDGNAEVAVGNAKGALVYAADCPVQNGKLDVDVKLGDCVPGIYWVEIVVDHKVVGTKTVTVE